MFDKERVDILLGKVAAKVKALPEDAIQKTEAKDTGKGYPTTGYGLDWIWEVLVEVIGPTHITLTVQDLYVEETQTAKAYRQFGVSLRSIIRIVDGGEVLAEASAFGGHVAHIRGDALKGAETNAKKKALAVWGIGIDVYKGILDDDAQPLPEGYDKPRERPRSDPVKSEGVSDKKGHPMIDNFMRLAAIIGKDKGDSEWAYVKYLAWLKDGKEIHAGIRTLEGWKKKALTDKHKRWLVSATAQLLDDFPELAGEADDITDKDIPF